MTSSAIQPRACINDDYWKFYIEHGKIWSRFSPKQRGEILAMPVIGHYLVRHVLSQEAANEFNAKATSGCYGQTTTLSQVELDFSRFASRSRLKSFLSILPDETGTRWESEHRQRSSSYPTFSQFSGKVVCGFARDILTRLVAAPGPLILSELLDEIGVGKKQTSLAAKALRGLCQYVFTIAAYDPEREDLILGLWPGLKKRFDGDSGSPPPPPPAAKAPATTFIAPFFCSDIAAVIVHAATKPILLKQAARLELYAAEERKLATGLDEVPSWVGDGLFQGRVRASVATFAAAGFDWLTLHCGKLQFISNKNGRDWLSLSPAGRLQKILDRLRDARWDSGRQVGLSFSHVTGRVRFTASDHDILACEDGIAAAFPTATCPSTSPRRSAAGRSPAKPSSPVRRPC